MGRCTVPRSYEVTMLPSANSTLLGAHFSSDANAFLLPLQCTLAMVSTPHDVDARAAPRSLGSALATATLDAGFVVSSFEVSAPARGSARAV
jgi:hypothetical protein